MMQVNLSLYAGRELELFGEFCAKVAEYRAAQEAEQRAAEQRAVERGFGGQLGVMAGPRPDGFAMQPGTSPRKL